MAASYCVKEGKACVRWVEKYFSDCLCNRNDDISFLFGFISLICWAVAEIPQIITNFHTKSSHGVSLAFLLTWVAGDIFNLVGCLLEPATLPTQYYTALLYTVTTIVLVLQSFYYDYIYKWCKRRQKIKNKNEKVQEEETKPLRPKPGHEAGIPIPNGTPNTIPNGTLDATPRREYYYMSARSLAGSGPSPFFGYMRAAKSGPSAMQLNDDDSSSEDDEATTTRVPSTTQATQPRPIPRSAAGSYGTFLAAAINLPRKGLALKEGYARFSGRKLLQEHETHSPLGQGLGWLMAAIYMGGRIPQIWLNIKRGSVEGLNPLMFVFALIANAAYVGSILVRSTEWKSIKANLPWLLDAVVCVALDLFIILQYTYYRYYYRRRPASDENGGDDHGYYQEARKAAAS